MVVREGGFEKAAEKLFLTQSAVSQRIKLLEQQLGQIVLTRTNPPVATDSGKIFIKHYHQVKQLEDDLIDSQTSMKRGNYASISLGINADSLATWFLPVIESMLAEEKILIELKVDDQEQTGLLMKNGEVSGCISSGAKSIQGCNQHYLGFMEYCLVSTSDFRNQWFCNGFTEQSIGKAPAIIFNQKDTLLSQFLYLLNLDIPENLPVNYIPSSEIFPPFILKNLAYGVVPLIQCREFLDKGRLVELSPLRLSVPLYWHHWNIRSQKLDALTRTIREKRKEFLTI
jgi:LysR family transcriptional regulator (chromosome initiation inhibitor)